MSATPPAISPRSRNRPAAPAAGHGPTSLATGARRVTTPVELPSLPVLIRLPNIVAAAANPRWRLPFAAIMGKLQRKYAVAAFAVFAVCLIAIVVKHRRPKTSVQELGGDAPAWTGVAVTPAATGTASTTNPAETAGPIFPQAAGQAAPAGESHTAHATGIAPTPTAVAPSAAAMNWQPPAHPAAPAAANPVDMNDRVPEMAARNPSRPAGSEVRTGQVPMSSGAADSFGRLPPTVPGVARFDGMITRPADAPASSSPPPWPYR